MVFKAFGRNRVNDVGFGLIEYINIVIRFHLTDRPNRKTKPNLLSIPNLLLYKFSIKKSIQLRLI
jgi:hypothetical protein